MPTLDWIGKNKVVNHHLDVPYCVLNREYSYDEFGQHKNDNGSKNMIIHGDNLLALKSLLPQYEGRIKCIYIDPPYNTGNEGWIYNDNVNDPRIKNWLGEVVGKEGEDLSRHDKWLCMMYPRLKLLQKLLSNDGVIFISIDDIEYANLKLICDEIFGATCFVSNISWQRTYSTRNDSKGIVNEVEHLIVYSKNSGWMPNKLPRTDKMNARFKNPDNDITPWTSSDAFAPDAVMHQGMVYAIQHPFTGKMIYPTNGRHWRYQQDEMLRQMSEWCPYELRNLHDEKERAKCCGIPVDEVRPDVYGIVLKNSLEESYLKACEIYKRGRWPKFYFTSGGKGGIRRKTYLENVGGVPPTNLWEYSKVGHTDEASKVLKAIFGGKTTFDTPKPYRLIEFILKIASNPDDIILDSFAGSGTTAHAVLNMNKIDGGHRKFILVELGDYADSITAERVKRVIKGYGEDKKTVNGTGGNFSYYELGLPVFDGERLNSAVDEKEIRKYIYFSETRRELEKEKMDEPAYMGTYMNVAYYFNYKKGDITSLNRTFLHTIRTKAEGYVIYADSCTLSERELEKWNIIFKKIPRDISRV
ncbi:MULTISPECIES: site-specific DNA-methyltransferase [Blautia]|uniref:site-specific DNA-methyltransferase n=1 Tax=Blautia TaxID=572511 RepID=UPI0022E932E9|nr:MULTISPECIES: site-specific DNA-methyltransferase [Blautia]